MMVLGWKVFKSLHKPNDTINLLQSLRLLVWDKCNKFERYNTRSCSKRRRGKELTTIVSKIREKVIDLTTIAQAYKKDDQFKTCW